MTQSLSEWEKQKLEEFKNLDFEKEIKPLLQKCYNLATSDVDCELPYTSVVLTNLKIITSSEPMSITFKQYKSMVMYSRKNEPINTSKLFGNSDGLLKNK
jgi:hypothetical protein